MEYEDRVAISTPEGLELEYSLAGVASRIFAGWVDYMMRILVVGAVTLLAYLAGGGVAGAIALAISVFIGLFVYDIAFEVWGGGQTPAKRWNGLRVVMDDGRPIGFAASAVRNLIRLIDVWLSFGVVAMVSVLATKRDQRLGDLAAGTLVIREPKSTPRRESQYVAIAPGVDVTAVSAAEVAAVRDFLSRREELAPAARARVAENLTRRLEPKVGGLPPGSHEPERVLETIAAVKGGA